MGSNYNYLAFTWWETGRTQRLTLSRLLNCSVLWWLEMVWECFIMLIEHDRAKRYHEDGIWKGGYPSEDLYHQKFQSIATMRYQWTVNMTGKYLSPYTNSSPKESSTVDDLDHLFDLQALFWWKIIVYGVHMNLQAVFVRVVSSFAWI